MNETNAEKQQRIEELEEKLHLNVERARRAERAIEKLRGGDWIQRLSYRESWELVGLIVMSIVVGFALGKAI